MNIQQNINLHDYNTFHLDCIADYFVEIKNIDDLHALIKTKVFQTQSRLILGGGSNILLTQARYQGLVIKNNILGKEIIAEDETSVTLKVGAGENRNDFIRRSIEQGYCGIENLVSIPGSVGAAPMQNIGAYGVEVGQYIARVTYIYLSTGDEHTLDADMCAFGYRDSIFKQSLKDKAIITHVTFNLQKYTPEIYQPLITYGTIQSKLEKQGYFPPWGEREGGVSPTILATTIASIRSSKLPDRTQIGTAGSFFKNPIISQEKYDQLTTQFPSLKGFPIRHSRNLSTLGTKGAESDKSYLESPEQQVKLSAGQLIDLSGLKGITQGSVGTYQNHALVLVHHGGGTGKDIVDLAKHIQQKVYDTFGIQIEPEVNYI